MTAPFDASQYQRVLERWRVLAEQRLEHMTQLYETGRWRRYFNEEQFIRVIRETRTAVDAWQRIAPAQATVAQLFPVQHEPALGRTQPPPSPFTSATESQRSVA
jgi:uncharacterized repeat protein (TIGR03809 family)